MTAADVTDPKKSRLGEALTATELNVLEGFSRGLENTDVGRELHLPMNTVKTHAAHAYEKLGARNRTQAVVTAIAGGLIQPGSAASLPKPLPKPSKRLAADPAGPPMMQVPAEVLDEPVAVVAGLVKSTTPLPMLRHLGARALNRFRAHIRNGHSTEGRAA